MSKAEAESPEQSVRKFSPFGMLGGLVVIFVLYVLSSGPVAKLYKGGRAPKAVEVAYTPLGALYKSSTPCRHFLDWYIHQVWRA